MVLVVVVAVSGPNNNGAVGKWASLTSGGCGSSKSDDVGDMQPQRKTDQEQGTANS